MDLDKYSDGGQLLITSTMDDQSCFNIINLVLESYSDVKNVELVDNYYKIDMSSWMHKKTIICWIVNNGQRKFLQFGYKYSTTILYQLIDLVIFVLLWILFSFIAVLILGCVIGIIEVILESRQLHNRCTQYIRDVNNYLMLNEPTNNDKTSATESSDLTIKCPSCGVSVSVDMKFCPSCGKEIPSKKFCSHCGAEMNPNMCFCPKCGNKVNC